MREKDDEESTGWWHWSKIGTLLLILLTSLANWVNTRNQSEQTRYLTQAESKRVLEEIHHIYTNQDEYLENIRVNQETNKMLRELSARIDDKLDHR